MDLQRLFLAGDGRTARQDFWIGIVILLVAHFIVGGIAGFLGWAMAGIWGAAFFGGLASVILAVPLYFLLLKRSNDRDYRQAYVQALLALYIAFQLKSMIMPPTMESASLLSLAVSRLIGLAGLWALIDLGFLQGTRGPNRYGPDPLA
jgi:uncharacterized membrane protein YhaH (DUF805 family)